MWHKTDMQEKVLNDADYSVLSDDLPLPSALRLYPSNKAEDEKGISIYFAPFTHINKGARIALIGITPGKSQMMRACRAAHQATRCGTSIPDAISEVKRLASFNDKTGRMRENLYKELDDWGIPEALSVSSGKSLFYENWNLVHTTSILKYPVFKNGKNYEGGTPKIMGHSVLKEAVYEILVPELKELKDAWLFPLGPKVSEVITRLQKEHKIKNRVYHGMMHPSTNNNYRFDYIFGDRNGPVPYRTNVRAYDKSRDAFKHQQL
jgi:hypothetical protein